MLNADALRLADRFIGVPLCFFLTALRFLFRPFRHGRNPPAPGRTLIVKLSEMGSTVLAYPAIAELKKRSPGVKIFFLVLKNNSSILDALDAAHEFDVLTIDADTPFRLMRSGLHALWRLRKESIDTTIAMDFFSRISAIIAFLVCRGNRVGFDRFTNEGLYSGRLLTHPVLYSPHVHTSVAFMSLVKALFEGQDRQPYCRIKIGRDDFRIPGYKPDPTVVRSAKAKLNRLGVNMDFGATSLVLVNPNSSDLFPLRRWPLRNFAQLAALLIEKREDVRIAVTGTKTEESDAGEILARVNNARCVSLAGMTTFPELLALYSLSDLMITNDSGPAHFAALLKLPTVVLFGPETPALYSPLNEAARCLYAGFSCSPCVSVYNVKLSPCRRSLCLEAITAEDVLDHALGMLK